MNYFVFDKRNSLDWRVGLSGSGTYNAPARRGEAVSIPGRDGDVWVDEGSFENILVIYPCWIAHGFDRRVDDFRAFLEAHGDQYYRLEDTYHPEEYRLARYPGDFVAEPGTSNHSGKFDIVFDCDPRRFLKSGEKDELLLYSESSTSGMSETIINPTYFKAYPILHIHYANIGSIYFNDIRLQITQEVTNTALDCETMVARDENTGSLVSAGIEFTERPYLKPGQNAIRETCSLSEGIAVYFTPRWYTL